MPSTSRNASPIMNSQSSTQTPVSNDNLTAPSPHPTQETISETRYLPPFFFTSFQIPAAAEVAKVLVQNPSKVSTFQRTRAKGYVIKEHSGRQLLVREWGSMEKTVDGFLYWCTCKPLDYADRTMMASVRMGRGVRHTLLIADVEIEGRVVQATCVCVEPEVAAALFGEKYL
ncbi:hypothetical protein BJ508DRAFT_306588 [Ascobolus immersus RN42]|uniref:Uncharacterized protein n=1 Tax=Ascobolus immersus RN42 TaxID=1160509 RepID=A0A3N4I9H3_ASCIM|nr:hypothetical protein BJ508DRAFT_306588 [Ascobolus immersus RN42]